MTEAVTGAVLTIMKSKDEIDLHMVRVDDRPSPPTIAAKWEKSGGLSRTRAPLHTGCWDLSACGGVLASACLLAC